MNRFELVAARQLLFFTVPEAAEQIGECSHRAWQRWEDGSRQVPDDVAETMIELMAWRTDALAAARSEIARSSKAVGEIGLDLAWYETLDGWANAVDPATNKHRDPILWRPQQSVVATIMAEYPDTALYDPNG